MRMRPSAIGLVLAMVVGLATPAAADYAAGARAFAAGDYAAAREAWEPLAETGDALAAFGLGVVLERGGRGVERDQAAAAAWYRVAAEAGVADAQLNLGNLSRLGLGVPEDPVAAVAWYRRAAAQGLAAAQYNIGRAYETGTGVAQDYREAARWYFRAAEQGDVDAALALAGLYRWGLGLARDPVRALAWYRRAADGGDPRAAFHLRALADETASAFARAEGARQRAVALGEPSRPAFVAPLPAAITAEGAASQEPAAKVTPRPAERRLAALSRPAVTVPDAPPGPPRTPAPSSASPPPPAATPEPRALGGEPRTGAGSAGRRPRARLAALGDHPIALPPATVGVTSSAPVPPSAPERPHAAPQEAAHPPAGAREGASRSAPRRPAPSRIVLAEAGPPPSLLAPSTEAHRVQLGAYREPLIAEHAWRRLVARSEGLLDGLDPVITKVDLGAEKGVFYRLQAEALPTADAARALCRALEARGTDCLIPR